MVKTRGIILGKGAPNRCRDGSANMCLISVSKDIGLFRAYPLKTERAEIRIWSECDFELEKTPNDNRQESFKLISIKLISQIEDPAYRENILNSCILKTGDIDPLEYQNNNLASIAIVRVNRPGAEIEARNHESKMADTDSPDSWVLCQSEHLYKPFIKWSSSQDKNHSSHLVSQEAYECLRKNPTDPWRLFSNYQLGNPEYDHWLVLGNMRDRRNVWVVVQIHRVKKKQMEDIMLPSSMIFVGNREGWPYLKQEKVNVKFVERQGAFNFIT